MARDQDFYSSVLAGAALIDVLLSRKTMKTTIVFPNEQSATAAFAQLVLSLPAELTVSDTSTWESGGVLTAKSAAAYDAELENVAERPED